MIYRYTVFILFFFLGGVLTRRALPLLVAYSKFDTWGAGVAVGSRQSVRSLESDPFVPLSHTASPAAVCTRLSWTPSHPRSLKPCCWFLPGVHSPLSRLHLSSLSGHLFSLLVTRLSHGPPLPSAISLFG